MKRERVKQKGIRREILEQVVGDTLYGEYIDWPKDDLVAEIVTNRLAQMSIQNLVEIHNHLVSGE